MLEDLAFHDSNSNFGVENVNNFSSISYFKILQCFNSRTYGTELWSQRKARKVNFN